MRAARTILPQLEQAPDSALYMERITLEQLESDYPDSMVAHAIQHIGHTAYAQSRWLYEIATDNGTDSSTLAKKAFYSEGSLGNNNVSAQMQRLEDSRGRGNELDYWIGTIAKQVDTDTLLLNASEQSRPVAFIKVDQQVSVPPIRLLFRLANIGISACIADINVAPEAQGKGIGTAMAYGALLAQPARMKSSLYTEANNLPMRSWAEKYGYKITDDYEDTRLFDGVSVPMLRYEARSIGSVLEKMETQRPELENMQHFLTSDVIQAQQNANL